MGNLVKTVIKEAAETAGFHFEYGSPEEIQERMSKLGKVNKRRFPVLMLFNNYEEDVKRSWTSVNGMQIIIGSPSKLKTKSESLDDKFNDLTDLLDLFLIELAKDNRIFGTNKIRFPHTQIRRYYDNMGGVPSIAWLVTFTENNNFKNICTNDRF